MQLRCRVLLPKGQQQAQEPVPWKGWGLGQPCPGAVLFPRVSSKARCLASRNLGCDLLFVHADNSECSVSQPLDKSCFPVCGGYRAQERAQYLRERQKNRKGGCRQGAREERDSRSPGKDSDLARCTWGSGPRFKCSLGYIC